MYLRFHPHFYKQKVGKKLVLIDPFKDMEERRRLEREYRKLYEEWFQAHLACHRADIPPPEWGPRYKLLSGASSGEERWVPTEARQGP